MRAYTCLLYPTWDGSSGLPIIVTIHEERDDCWIAQRMGYDGVTYPIEMYPKDVWTRRTDGDTCVEIDFVVDGDLG